MIPRPTSVCPRLTTELRGVHICIGSVLLLIGFIFLVEFACDDSCLVTGKVDTPVRPGSKILVESMRRPKVKLRRQVPPTSTGSQTVPRLVPVPPVPKDRPQLHAETLVKRNAFVAILIMLPSDPMSWGDVLGHMATRSHVDAFVLLWERPSSAQAVAKASALSRGALAAVWHEPGTMWSTGRNSLARAAYAAEVARGSQYRYWLFLDEELPGCRGCDPDGTQPEATQAARIAACCLDYAVEDVLLGPYNWALVGVHSPPRKESPEPFSDAQARSFELQACPDAKFAAMHRAAAPVLLPYITEFDATAGWWSSQFLLL